MVCSHECGQSFTGSVGIVPGVHFEGDSLPLAGITVAAAKAMLRVMCNIPYFADAVVNGRPVVVGYVLRANDCLGFSKRYGFKAGGDQRIVEAEAEGLLVAYPELTRMAEDVRQLGLPVGDSLRAMTVLVAHWVLRRFGPPDAHAERVVEQLLRCMGHTTLAHTPAANRSAPKGAPGRKPETLDIAEYANELRLEGKTWKEVLKACKQRWQNDLRVRNVRQIRATWDRHFGNGKSRH